MSALVITKAFATSGAFLNKYSESQSTLQNMGIKEMVIVNDIPNGDSLVKTPTVRIDFNDTSYAFLDENEKIIRIDRVEEINRKHSEKSNEMIFGSEKEAILFVEKNLIGPEYICVSVNEFDPTTRVYRYEKKLKSGGEDQYDSFTVRIDSELYDIITLYKRESSFIDIGEKPKISASQALELACSELTDASDKNISIRLQTVKTNNRYGYNGAEKEISLAYVIASRREEIYVDAYDGRIIGGDTFKDYLGGTVGAAELDYASYCVSDAKYEFEEMGYDPTGHIVTTQMKNNAPAMMKKAFYACTHGNEQYMSSMYDMSDPYRKISYLEVPTGDYRLVYLDFCCSRSTYWLQAFGISRTSINKVFLGWSDLVTQDDSYDFFELLWPEVSRYTSFRHAVINAADLQGEDIPIAFYGDYDYNGYY